MPEHWTPEDIGNYEGSIRAARRQRAEQERRKDQWLEDFIDSQDMRGRPFDSHCTSTARGKQS